MAISATLWAHVACGSVRPIGREGRRGVAGVELETLPRKVCTEMVVARSSCDGYGPLLFWHDVFLADRTIGRAFGTLCHLSVICPSSSVVCL